MRLRPLIRPLAAAAALAAVATVTAASEGAPNAPALQKITKERVGGVHLGDRHKALRAAGLVGRIGPGCELAPNTRSAALKMPLKGTVNYTLKSPRKVTDITVTGGAAARGVGIGAKRSALRHTFPNAKFDHSTDKVFGLTLVTAPHKNGKPRLQFAVSTKTHKVTLIGVPIIAFCE